MSSETQITRDIVNRCGQPKNTTVNDTDMIRKYDFGYPNLAIKVKMQCQPQEISWSNNIVRYVWWKRA